MLSTAGRVALISGANRGIGFAVAQSLYAAGYAVSLGARDARAMAELVSDWEPDRVSCHRYDAEDQATHQAWIDATAEQFGRIDGLINNAGMVVRVQVEDEKDDILDQMWAVNVKAPLSMIRKALPYLRESGSGRIVNVASLAGKQVSGNNVGYAMTKFALVALSHATRRLGWEDGVRSTALCPGFVSTDMTADVESFPRGDMMEPGDLAELVRTVMALSNSASVAELIVNCRNDVTM